eukprot:1079002-Amphidinium_carterae.1
MQPIAVIHPRVIKRHHYSEEQFVRTSTVSQKSAVIAPQRIAKKPTFASVPLRQLQYTTCSFNPFILETNLTCLGKKSNVQHRLQ